MYYPNQSFHTHQMNGLTGFADNHNHAYYGITAYAPQGIGHVHYFRFNTSLNDGHIHVMESMTGPAIYLPDGSHYHCYYGMTSFNGDGPHAHNYYGNSSI